MDLWITDNVLCLMTAYDVEREANITMTYVPAHLYYVLFELMKVSKHFLLMTLDRLRSLFMYKLTLYHLKHCSAKHLNCME